MKLKEGRGAYGARKKEMNIKKIKYFIKNNPSATKKDLKDSTGLSWTTVLKHLKSISEE